MHRAECVCLRERERVYRPLAIAAPCEEEREKIKEKKMKVKKEKKEHKKHKKIKARKNG